MLKRFMYYTKTTSGDSLIDFNHKTYTKSTTIVILLPIRIHELGFEVGLIKVVNAISTWIILEISSGSNGKTTV
jgi:hypothetical protein